MFDLFYDIVKGNKTNRFYITSAIMLSALNILLWFGVTTNPKARVESDFLCILIGMSTPILHVVLFMCVIFLLYRLYRVKSYCIVYQRAEDFVKKEFAKPKRINILDGIEHYVYAKYVDGVIYIRAYDKNGVILNDYKTEGFVAFLKEVNPSALKKIKRGMRLHEVF